MSQSRTAQLITPSEDEAKNGWTAEKLTAYVNQRFAADHDMLMSRLFPDKPPLKIESVAFFDPHNW